MSQITVSAGVIGMQYQGNAEVLTLRIYARKAFTTSDDEPIVKGSIGSENFYKEVACTLNPDNSVAFEEFTIDSTIDGSPADAFYAFGLFDENGDLAGMVHSRIVVPDTPTTTTLGDLAVYSNQPEEDLTLTLYQQLITYILNAINGLVNMATKATTSVFGATRMSFAPASANTPIAVENNDPITRAARKTFQLESYGNTGTALDNAIAAIGSTVCDLEVSSLCAISTNDPTIPDNITVKFTGTTSGFAVTSGHTLTISKMISPGARQVFFGSGNVVLETNAVEGGAMWLDWWAEPGTGGDSTHAIEQIMLSQANGNLKTRAGVGTWKFNEWTVPSFGQIEGSGIWDGNGTRTGTIFEPYETAAESFMIKIEDTFRALHVRNLCIFLDTNADNCRSIVMEGTSPLSAKIAGIVENCSLISLADSALTQVVINATDGAWECTEFALRNNLIITNPNSKSFSINTPNSQIEISGNEFICAAGVTNIYLEGTGFTTIRNNSFGGVGGLHDVETHDSDLTGVGNLTSGEPYLTLTTGQFDESIIGCKITVLTFSAYVIGIVDPETTQGLANKVHLSANSNINATSEDVAIYTYSPDPLGAYTPIHVAGPHRTLNIESNVDEGYQYSMVIVGLQIEYPITLKNNKFQHRILVQNSCTITDAGGNDWLSHQFIDGNPGQLTTFIMGGSTLSNTSINKFEGTPVIVLDEPEIWGGVRGDGTYTQTNDSHSSLLKTVRELPFHIRQRRTGGVAGIPLFSVGSAIINVLQPLLEWGRLHPITKKIDKYYRVGYDYASGKSIFWSNVHNAYKAWQFQGKVEVKSLLILPQDDEPEITGDTNNWDPWEDDQVQSNLTVTSDGWYDITGLKLPDDPALSGFTMGSYTGLEVRITYSGAYGLRFIHASTDSDLANRFLCDGGYDINITDGETILIRRKAAFGERWRITKLSPLEKNVMLATDYTLAQDGNFETIPDFEVLLGKGYYKVEMDIPSENTTYSPKMDLDGGDLVAATLFTGTWSGTETAPATANVAASDTPFSVPALDTKMGKYRFVGTFLVDTPGTFTPQFAQRTADASDTKILAGAWLTVTPVKPVQTP